MKRKKLIVLYIGLVVTIFVLQGCGNGDKNQDITSQNAVDVEVANVISPSSDQIFSYSGMIEESETIPLSFQVVGNIKKVNVKEGDFVKQGQVLAELNDETYKNSYDMSAATLKQAEDAYKRLQPMYKNGNLPEIKIIEVETSLQQAKSAVAIAKKNIDDCILRAPVSGMVGKRSIEPGMSAMPGFTAINIVKIEKVYARIPVPENEIASVKKGAKAVIRVSAIGNEELQGSVEEIGVLADPLAHSYKIKIALNNPRNLLKPGMICSAALKSGKLSGVIAAPTKAVQIDDKGKNFVYTIEGNKAVKKYIITGELIRDAITVKEGLTGGEKIVIAGQNRITENSIVNILNK
jgi:RND family efflux transporter MFP subunit